MRNARAPPPGAEPEPEGSSGTSPPVGTKRDPGRGADAAIDPGAIPVRVPVRARSPGQKKPFAPVRKAARFREMLREGRAKPRLRRARPRPRPEAPPTEPISPAQLRRQIQTLSKTQPKRSFLVRAPSTPERGRRREARGGRIRAPTGEHSLRSRLKVKMKGASRDTCDRSRRELKRPASDACVQLDLAFRSPHPKKKVKKKKRCRSFGSRSAARVTVGARVSF